MYSTYLKGLAKDYLDTIAALSSGMYSDNEIRYLEAERGTLHLQLMDELDNESIRASDMPDYARRILYD